MSALHVYLIEDDGELYHWVATDPMDAFAQHVEDTFGGSVEDFKLQNPRAWAERLPDPTPLTISFPPTSCDPEGRDPETRTLAEWAEHRGRGLLCSTVDESR